MWRAKRRRKIALAVVIVLLLSTTAIAGKGDKKKNADGEYAMTEADLQAELMSYGDRFASVAAQAMDDVRELKPPPELQRMVTSDLVYSAAAAYTIAADENPQVALLDLMVLATLGRMVFEEHWQPKYGAYVDPVVSAMDILEPDIWKIADNILSAEQKTELLERIAAFRQAHPDLLTFSHLRFVDFPSTRATSTFQQKKGGGMFKSVRRITEQVEETRMLAERGLYLSTRLPLLSGFFADIWLSQLSVNPAVEEVLGDVHTFADTSERLAAVAEQLPAQIAEERNATILQLAQEVAALREDTINHAFEEFAKERNDTIEQFAAEEERLKGVLAELRQTLEAGTDLSVSVNSLADKLDLGESPAGAPPARPFDIEDYRKTLVDAQVTIRDLNELVGSAHQLLDSHGAENLVPQLVAAIDDVGEESRSVVNLTFVRAVILILIALTGYVVARLTYRSLARRMFDTAE